MPAKSKKPAAKKTTTKKNVNKTQTKKNTKSKTTKPTTPVVEAPVVETPPVVETVAEPVVAEPVVETPAVTTEGGTTDAVVEQVSEFDKMKEQLNQIQAYVSTIGSMSFDDLKKNLQKDLNKMTKNSLTLCNKLEKEYNKATKKKTKRAQSQGTGFEKKVLISDNFKKFILDHCDGSVDEDNKISRKEGSNYIHTYIKGNNIQKPECKRHLNPDKALQMILSPLSDEVNPKTGKKDSDIGYTYFNLQKYLKGCYVVSQ